MAEAQQKAKKTKKGRKHGRNTKSGQNIAYKREARHEKSHVRRILKHLKRYGERTQVQVDNSRRKRSLQANGDQVALQALARYKLKAGT